MKLNQVRYFLALCEEGNFTRAASRCGVSQPSLSNGIRRLEQDLGGRLFHRGNHELSSLSELGRALRPQFERMAQCADAIRHDAERLNYRLGRPNEPEGTSRSKEPELQERRLGPDATYEQ